MIENKFIFTSLNKSNESLFEELLDGFSSIFILVDTNTKHHCYDLIASFIPMHTLIEVGVGENYKTLSELSLITEKMVFAGADRNSVLINFGGGKITDLGSFAASVFKRGIQFINVPTTLLAMVDAVVGGKTGINFKKYKNQLGTFSKAHKTIIIPDFLKTLPETQILSGFGEMIKHALISSNKLWEKISQINDINSLIDIELIKESILIKSEIVELDFRELGERKKLNFGHTIGHALESCYLDSNNEVPHGIAIAQGMIYEAYLSFNSQRLGIEDFRRIKNLLLKYFPEPDIEKIDESKFKAYIVSDKKNQDKKINFTLLEGIGNATYNNFVDLDEVWSLIKRTKEICSL
jgi:3-dehydroquinate synthase